MSLYTQLPHRFNREGAALFSSGDLQKASECFQNALEALESGCRGVKPLSCHDKLAEEGSLHCYGECGHFIYSTPFVMRITDEDEGLFSLTELQTQRAAILFNLGLSFQQRSLRSTGEVHLLRTAMSYYDACLKLLEREKLLMECSNLCIAALNNKASLYFEVMAFSQGYKTFQLLNFMMQRREVTQALSLPNEVLTSIVLNISNSWPPRLERPA